MPLKSAKMVLDKFFVNIGANFGVSTENWRQEVQLLVFDTDLEIKES